MVTASFEWQTPPSVLVGRLEEWKKRLHLAIFALGQFFAAKMETYAKQNATWTDRTTNARQGLTGLARKTATGVIIYLLHKMGYGIWLELAHAGRYAIILRTMEEHYGPLMSSLKKMVSQ